MKDYYVGTFETQKCVLVFWAAVKACACLRQTVTWTLTLSGYITICLVASLSPQVRGCYAIISTSPVKSNTWSCFNYKTISGKNLWPTRCSISQNTLCHYHVSSINCVSASSVFIAALREWESVWIQLKPLGNAAYVACLLRLCQGSERLNGKSVRLVYRRSWVQIQLDPRFFYHLFLTLSTKKEEKGGGGGEEVEGGLVETWNGEGKSGIGVEWMEREVG